MCNSLDKRTDDITATTTRFERERGTWPCYDEVADNAVQIRSFQSLANIFPLVFCITSMRLVVMKDKEAKIVVAIRYKIGDEEVERELWAPDTLCYRLSDFSYNSHILPAWATVNYLDHNGKKYSFNVSPMQLKDVSCHVWAQQARHKSKIAMASNQSKPIMSVLQNYASKENDITPDIVQQLSVGFDECD